MLELGPRWAPNLYTALTRIDGRPVGIIANQPKRMAGVIDSPASEKGAWFVNLCDRFGIPLVVLVDTPGFMPGTKEESRGVIRLGATLVRAFASATVPKVTVVLRKAFGGAFITMNSRSLGADLVLAWPGAEVGVMAAGQAVGVMHGKQLAGRARSRRAASGVGVRLRRRTHFHLGRRRPRLRGRSHRPRVDPRPHRGRPRRARHPPATPSLTPQEKGPEVLVRSIDEVKTVAWGNGLSRRFLLESDGMGYSLTDTLVLAGTQSPLQYVNHLEACYCISGSGWVHDTDGTQHRIEPGVMYALEQHDAHILEADAAGDMRLVCVFSPALRGDEVHQLDGNGHSAYGSPKLELAA